MGKKKDKDRVKLPKRVAGIKLPKELRHGSEAVLTQVRDHVGAELLVAGAALAATALRPTKTPTAPADPSPAPFDAEAFGRAAGLVATVAAGALAALAKQKPEKD